MWQLWCLTALITLLAGLMIYKVMQTPAKPHKALMLGLAAVLLGAQVLMYIATQR